MKPLKVAAVAIAISLARTILVVSMLSINPVNADTPAAVIGSFKNLENAVAAQERVKDMLTLEARILKAEINSAIWYRVIIQQTGAHALVKDLVKLGYKDAWLLRDVALFERTAEALNEKTAEALIKKTAEALNVKTAEALIKKTAEALIPPVTPVVVPMLEQAPALDVDPDGGMLAITKLENVAIKIDGKLDEALWAELPAFDNMRVVEPDLLTAPRHATKTRIFYTNEGIYVGISAHQPSNTLIPRLSSRDGDINRDGTMFYLDTSGEGRYGFFFGVNLGGTLIDGTLLPERQLSRLWDGAWYGSAVTTSDGYSTEMFLPWSMMAMPDGSDVRKMAFAVSRKVAYLDEEWQWPALPSSKPRFISGLEPIQLRDVAPRQQLAFYPFTAATINNMREETDYRTGMDIFWRPSTNLQVTATLKPDFGTVESDDVVVNLTDFETFFPEKRLFFLEGSDTFITSPRSQIRSSTSQTSGARKVASTFFLAPTTLLNTRRIGGAPVNPVVPLGVTVADIELSKPSALSGAAKITGQNGKLSYGAMFASEEDVEIFGTQANGDEVILEQEGRDFGVLRFLRENTTQGRRSLGWISTIAAHPTKDAITHGLDAHYLSPTGKFFWDAQLLASDIEDVEGYGGFIDLSYIPKQGDFHRFTIDTFDENLDVSDLGFIRRNDITTFRYTFNRSTSKLKKIRSRSNSLSFSHEYNGSGQMVRTSIFNRNIVTLNNRNQITTVAMWRPKQWDDGNSDGNGAYKTAPGGVFDISLGTASSKAISTSIGAVAITEPLGDISYIAKAGITFKPNDRFSLDFDYTYRRTDHWMVHLADQTMGGYDATHIEPKLGLDVFLSAKQHLRLSMQWVGIKARAQDLYQIPLGDGELVRTTNGLTVPTYDFTLSRLTTQLRYRWEIAPLSDLFLVYTRGSNLPNRGTDEFDDLFHDSVTEPLIDRFVLKLRYRFGN